MQIALLGSGGQLGSEWKRFCEQNNQDYVEFDYPDFDITDANGLKEQLIDVNPDLVINATAYTQVDQAEDEPGKALEVNATGVDNLARLCKQQGWKLVHYSTDYVFPGRMADRERYPAGYPEDADTDPINVYGSTKREGEKHLLESDVDFLLIRVSWLCGAMGNNFVKTMLKLGKNHSNLKVVDDQWGSPTFTKHVVETTSMLIEQSKKGIYHVTSEGLITWYQLAAEIFEQQGMDVKVEAVDSDAFPTKAERPHFSKLSTDKLKAIDTYRPLDWKDGLRDLLEEL